MNNSKQRTNIFIFHQMAQLLKHTPYSQISVTDIVKASLINRNTFYHHFKNKQDLLFQGFQYLLKKENILNKEPLPIFVKNIEKRPFYTLNNFYKKFYPIYYQSQLQDDFNIIIFRIFKKFMILATKGRILWVLGRIDTVILWNRYKNNYFDILSPDYKKTNSDPQKLDKIYQEKHFPNI